MNCTIDSASVYPTYRRPFDMIFERGQKRRMVGVNRFALYVPESFLANPKTAGILPFP